MLWRAVNKFRALKGNYRYNFCDCDIFAIIGCAMGSANYNGARGRDRTADTAIFSRMLYQLSYPGMVAKKRSALLCGRCAAVQPS